ncbi:hypothetical protein K3495_g915 [Podosphaera aphanis]|nr:hypothetical protein K3495_g915 [Podosphaera aphanis]
MSTFPFPQIPNPTIPWSLWPTNFPKLASSDDADEVEDIVVAPAAAEPTPTPTPVTNHDKRFEAVYTMIEDEFAKRKEAFKGFSTERHFVQSPELQECIRALKHEIACWSDHLQDLPWIEDYFETLIVDHWRRLAVSEASPDVRMLDATDTPKKGDALDEKSSLLPPEPRLTSPTPSPQSAVLERANFVLICVSPNGTRIVEPDPELAATSCLVGPHAIAAHAHNYSWDLFRDKFERLLNEGHVGEPISLTRGSLTYVHPDDPTRVITNQEQFAVALNYAGSAPDNRIRFTFFVENKNTPATAHSTSQWDGASVPAPGHHHQSTGPPPASRLPVFKGSRRNDALAPLMHKPGWSTAENRACRQLTNRATASTIRRSGIRSGNTAVVMGRAPMRSKARATRVGLERWRGRVAREISQIRPS